MNYSNAPPTNLQYGPDTPALYRELNKFEKDKSRELTIMYLNIHSLPPLPEGLEELSCEQNQLTSLPELPDGLRVLSCYENQLTSLPELPDGLEVLSCKQNQLTSLPSLPDGLEVLFCHENQLTSLPTLPNRIQYLSCEQNQLTSLPTLPEGLRELGCEQNQLTSLPELPDHLQVLNCSVNQLTSLPPLPDGLRNLLCGYNQLTSLPTLPNTLTYLYCKQNPNLVNITGACPPSLRNNYTFIVFEGCPNLVPQPVPGETLGAFFDRAANPGELPVPEELIVPEGSENSIMMSEIQNGNILANFHNEKNFKRYYLKSTVNQLKNNPSTRKPIQPRNIKLYRARLTTNRNTRSNHLTNVSIGGKKTRRYKKRKAKKTRRV
jgi:hypothetical protein